MAEDERGDGSHGERTGRNDDDTYDQLVAHTQEVNLGQAASLCSLCQNGNWGHRGNEVFVRRHD
ncbi:hypothetical protein [Bradyrhizobium sp. CCBAU 53338]|uniref:hypothetical protein n=1 Tax=Bradyrhizobium sp. CCBAU 53338 TaxID=1325111 RepID=UPI00188A0D87|nr:hypothetical protein [Bradyrhizobium sp. CCBAU 53338]